MSVQPKRSSSPKADARVSDVPAATEVLAKTVLAKIDSGKGVVAQLARELPFDLPLQPNSSWMQGLVPKAKKASLESLLATLPALIAMDRGDWIASSMASHIATLAGPGRQVISCEIARDRNNEPTLRIQIGSEVTARAVRETTLEHIVEAAARGRTYAEEMKGHRAWPIPQALDRALAGLSKLDAERVVGCLRACANRGTIAGGHLNDAAGITHTQLAALLDDAKAVAPRPVSLIVSGLLQHLTKRPDLDLKNYVDLDIQGIAALAATFDASHASAKVAKVNSIKHGELDLHDVVRAVDKEDRALFTECMQFLTVYRPVDARLFQTMLHMTANDFKAVVAGGRLPAHIDPTWLAGRVLEIVAHADVDQAMWSRCMVAPQSAVRAAYSRMQSH